MCMHIYKYMIKLLVTDKLSEKYLTKSHRIELLNAIKTIKHKTPISPACSWSQP